MPCNNITRYHLSEYLLSKYKNNCKAYDWLRVMAKGTKWCTNLNVFLKNDRTCYIDICKVNTSEELKNGPAGYILSVTTKGLFIVVLEDTSSGCSHTVGINGGLKVIYKCMETHELGYHIYLCTTTAARHITIMYGNQTYSIKKQLICTFTFLTY